MGIKEAIKKGTSAYNPIAIRRRNRMRDALVNQTMTLLCPNCLGGILFHDLGLKFQSPTVNLMMTQPDFIKFVTNLDHYLNGELQFFDHSEYTCPCAHLEDITIHFTHYKTPADAAKKWRERAGRIQKGNLFIFAEERDGLTKEDILALGGIEFIRPRGIVVFTAKKYPDIPYALHIPKYESGGEIGNILQKSYLDDSREYEKYFDFVKWFNEADGRSYDISSFSKL